MERYYRAADVFAMLSKFDTFGMAVLEAMAAGLPAVISSNVGAKNVVQDGVNGFVLPDPRDDDAVAGAIAAMADPAVRYRIGAEAQRTASRYTWDRTADEVARVYDAVASGRGIPQAMFGKGT